MKFKKRSILTFTIVLLSIITFNYLTGIDSKALLLSNNTLGGLIQIAMAEEGGESGGGSFKCFIVTKLRCTDMDGGERVICDASGDYKQGEECTEVPCGVWPPKKIVCKKIS